MTREELLKSPEYWVTKAQIELYECAYSFMEETGLNRKGVAEHLGVSKSYVSQLLSGNFDHRLSKLVELSLAFGYIPKVDFIPTEQYLRTGYVYCPTDYIETSYKVARLKGVKKNPATQEWMKLKGVKEVA